jgi:1-deoxy-D-xylulose-5-phosphate synthase
MSHSENFIRTNIKSLKADELNALCFALRRRIIRYASSNGGHLGASLGAVDIVVAMHRVFEPPKDRFFFDVGHQAYAHKLLTGREKDFEQMRKFGGISGFPRRSESVFDTFGTGHSSTAISAALGFAKADELNGSSVFNLVLVGDGAMTAGIVFEALQQLKYLKANLLILLNDNGMSIDGNTGALHEHFRALQSGGCETSVFELLGIPYEGVYDGHDVNWLVEKFSEYKKNGGIKVLHLKTVKGKGLPQAENDPVLWHSPPKFDPETGEKIPQIEKKKFHQVFGEKILEIGEKNPRLVIVTPAMKAGSGLTKFAEKFPERFFDTAITEQHAVTFSSGLAFAGMKVFCSIYSTFLQRAYDQVIHDVCLQNAPVIFCIDRAGLVGGDGATHHGLYDLAFLSCLPNAVICAPASGEELCAALDFAVQYDETPLFIRYPRGNVPETLRQVSDFVKGKGVKWQEGKGTAILAIGIAAEWAREASEFAKTLSADFLQPAIYNLRFLKPLDEEILREAFSSFDYVITIEDAAESGGLSSAVRDWAFRNNLINPIFSFSAPDTVIEHGETEDLRKFCATDKVRIAEKIIALQKNFLT